MLHNLYFTVVCAAIICFYMSGCSEPTSTVSATENKSDQTVELSNSLTVQQENIDDSIIEASDYVSIPIELVATNQSNEYSEAKKSADTKPSSCAAGCPWPDYNVSSTCCNAFGCNCDGPCWNAGCQTVCQAGKYPGKTVSCHGSDKHYNCCPTGSKCKSNKTCSAKKGECCCTGGGKTIVSISDIEYDLSNSTKTADAVSTEASYQYKGSNNGPNPHPVGTVNSSVTSIQTTEWSFQSSTEISAEAEVKAGIPFFGDGKLTIGAKETLTYGESHSKSVETTREISLGEDLIPPYSNQAYVFRASMHQFNIPFKAVAVVVNDCGDKSTETIVGSSKLAGVASLTEGEFSKIIGPAVPVECREPFDTPIDKQRTTSFCSSGPMCKDNALCMRYGQTTGTCCAPGSEQPCCAIAAANPKCIEQGYDKDKQLCPAANGNFAPCCNSRETLLQAYDGVN